MGKKKTISEDVFKLLDINMVNLVQSVQKDCSIYDIIFDIEVDRLCPIVDSVIQVDIEELDEEPKQKRAIIQKRDGSGVYVSIKNIRFYPVEFAENIVQLVNNKEPIIIFFWFLNLAKKFSYPMNKNEMLIFSILFGEIKNKIITDENIVKTIMRYLEEYCYDQELDQEEIDEIIKILLRLGIIRIEDGKYIIIEKCILNMEER